MMLARCEAEAPDELRADFQQFYGLDLDGMGSAYTVDHAACLAAQLPSDSRTVRRIDPGRSWGWCEHLLANIEYWTHALVWAKTKDARNGTNKPKRISPGDTDEARERKHLRAVAKRRRVDEILGKGGD